MRLADVSRGVSWKVTVLQVDSVAKRYSSIGGVLRVMPKFRV